MPMRPAASSSSSSSSSSSPSSSMDHRTPSPPPRLQLPSAVVLLRRRRTPRSPRQQLAAIRAVPPPAALPAPSAGPHLHQIPAVGVGAADADNLMLLAHIAVFQADADAEASPPPAPAPNRCPQPPPLPLPPLALAVDHPNPSSLSVSVAHGDDAATKATAGDCKKAACSQLQGNADAGSSGGDHSGGRGMASPAAGASPMQLGDDDEDEELELELGEIPPEKPAPGCNANPAHESLLDKEETGTEGEEAKTIAAAGELAATGSSAAHRRAPAVAVSVGVVVGSDGKGKAAATATEMSAAEQKRMREVFVGGLSKDTTEEDVRAAFSRAGEITEVRLKKCYCFVAYRDAAMASKAVAELGNVKICGKQCRVAISEGNENTNKTAQRDPIIEDYNRIYEQRQPSPTLAVHSSYIASWDHQNNTYAIPASSYIVPPLIAIPPGYYYPTMYHNGNNMYLPPPDLNNGLAGPSGRSQMGQSGSSKPGGQPHRSRN